jgi:hypothetical protein
MGERDRSFTVFFDPNQPNNDIVPCLCVTRDPATLLVGLHVYMLFAGMFTCCLLACLHAVCWHVYMPAEEISFFLMDPLTT